MYYQIESSVEPKIIGVRNGTCQIKFKEQHLPDLVNSLFLDLPENYDLRNQRLLDANFEMLSGRSLKSAKNTDFSIFTPNFFGCRFIISKKVNTILEKLGIPKNEYKSIPIQVDSNFNDHYLLFIPPIDYKYYNFRESKIYPLAEHLKSSKKYLDINSYKEFMDYNGTIFFEKIVIDKKFSNNFLINFRSHIHDFVISNKVYDALKKENVSNLIISKTCSLLEFQ